MEFIQTIVLGLIQGLTEFLPVSSSGHHSGGGSLLDQFVLHMIVK